MQIAQDARMVLRWTCQVCQHGQYFESSAGRASQAAREEVAQELGCDPSELACIPEVLHCQKCEEPHKLPDSFGIELEE